MGNKSKTKRSLERKAKKRDLKDQQRRLYLSYKEAGKNKKSKRQRSSKAQATVKSRNHSKGRCGNTGCLRCTPVNPTLWKPPMPRWIWLEQRKLSERSLTQ